MCILFNLVQILGIWYLCKYHLLLVTRLFLDLHKDDQTTGEPVGGKRQRKPNRRYFEDEGDAAGGGTPVNRLASGDSEGEEMSTRLSWRTVEADGPADMIGRHGTLRGPVLRNSSRPNLSIVQRSKPINNVMVCTHSLMFCCLALVRLGVQGNRL